jgi:PAS domain S-box-containing protein
MQRTHREIARDVARVAALPLAQVVVVHADPPRAVTTAVDGAALVTPARRAAVTALLERAPGHAAAAALLEPGTTPLRATAPCEAALARALWPRQPGARAHSVFFRLGAGAAETVLLRLVVAGPLRVATVRALESLARLAAGRLEAVRGRRDAARRDAAFRVFQESAGEAMLVVDPRSGRVLEGNRKVSELTGLRPSELRRLTLDRVLDHPLHHGPALLAHLASERVVRDDEARIVRRRGEPVPVAVTTARIELPDRAVLHVIARDVTRERRAVAELRQAKDTLAALHLAAAQLQAETGEEAVYRVLARELARLGFHCAVLAPAAPGPGLGWRFSSFTAPMRRAFERVLGKPLSAVRVVPAEAPLVRRCLESGRTVHTDRARRAARELLGGADAAGLRTLGRHLGFRRVVLAPLRGGGRTTGILAVAVPRVRRSDPEAIDAFARQASLALDRARLFAALSDERARLETEVERRTRELRDAVRALEESGRRKDHFLANVSHELRTPLVTVLGYADLLSGGKLGALTESQRSALQVIGASGRRLKGFIEELLELERHELTRGQLALAPFEIGDVLTQAVLALAPRFAERGVRLRARVARGTPLAWGDRERVLQVLVNLLVNAERYSPDGATVRAAAARAPDGRVVAAVTDRGAGIADEHLGHIFERLYQVRDDRSPKHKGGALGLGLALVKSIVEAHGGEVAVRSRVGVGTRFRFTLPAAAHAGGQGGEPVTPAAPDGAPPAARARLARGP